MTSLADVISFSAKKAELRPPAACACCGDKVCYPHRVAAAADVLRSLPDDLDGDAWVMRGDVRRLAAVVLAQLDAITTDSLPATDNEATR